MKIKTFPIPHVTIFLPLVVTYATEWLRQHFDARAFPADVVTLVLHWLEIVFASAMDPGLWDGTTSTDFSEPLGTCTTILAQTVPSCKFFEQVRLDLFTPRIFEAE